MSLRACIPHSWQGAHLVRSGIVGSRAWYPRSVPRCPGAYRELDHLCGRGGNCGSNGPSSCQGLGGVVVGRILAMVVKSAVVAVCCLPERGVATICGCVDILAPVRHRWWCAPVARRTSLPCTALHLQLSVLTACGIICICSVPGATMRSLFVVAFGVALRSRYMRWPGPSFVCVRIPIFYLAFGFRLLEVVSCSVAEAPWGHSIPEDSAISEVRPRRTWPRLSSFRCVSVQLCGGGWTACEGLRPPGPLALQRLGGGTPTRLSHGTIPS